MKLLNLITTVTAVLRGLATAVPVLIDTGKAEKITGIINDIAELADRGVEAFDEVKADLEQLAADLKAMDGVSAEDREALLEQIVSRSDRIQAAAEALRAQQAQGS